MPTLFMLPYCKQRLFGMPLRANMHAATAKICQCEKNRNRIYFISPPLHRASHAMRAASCPRKLIGRQGDDSVFNFFWFQRAIPERFEEFFGVQYLVAGLPEGFFGVGVAVVGKGYAGFDGYEVAAVGPLFALLIGGVAVAGEDKFHVGVDFGEEEVFDGMVVPGRAIGAEYFDVGA